MKQQVRRFKPSDRIKKRYLVFRLKELKNTDDAKKLIQNQIRYAIGVFGLDASNFYFLKNRYNEKTGIGIFRVSVKSLENIKKAMNLISQKIQIIGISGMINQCERFIKKQNNAVIQNNTKKNIKIEREDNNHANDNTAPTNGI